MFHILVSYVLLLYVLVFNVLMFYVPMFYVLPLACKPTEESYLKLDKPTALLSFTVIQSLNFLISRKYFLEKFTV